MEFPDLGEHCFEKTCKQLDFLPLNCDAYDKVFCKYHVQYERHKCTATYKKDVQVPVCPLCYVPVPVGRGEIADVLVGQHMDTDCKYNPTHEKKIFIHRCSKEGCKKKKEMLQLLCDQCNDNFCIKHRHPLDHNCKHSGHPISKAGCAAIMRATESSGASNKLSSKAQRLRGKQQS